MQNVRKSVGRRVREALCARVIVYKANAHLLRMRLREKLVPAAASKGRGFVIVANFAIRADHVELRCQN